MKESIKKLNKPFVLIVLFLIKAVALPFGWIDAVILAILSLVYITKYSVDRYMDMKDKVLSENMFRSKVNVDIAKLANDVSEIKMQNFGANQGKRR